jgi:hypothetical protein
MDAPVVALHGPSLAPAGARGDATGAGARGGEASVVAVDEQDARFELGRPARIALVGWVVQGTSTVGNTAASDVIVPENRMSAGQRFEPRTYVTLHVRGRRASAQVHLPGEVRVDGEPAPHALEGLEGRRIGIVRRDDRGEEDFLVNLELSDDPSLPDPRARLLRLDASDPMVRALGVRGAPLRAARTLTLGPLGLTLRFDGERLVVEDYLASYQRDGGYQSFFVARGGERYRTAPEDGGPIALSRGDRLITGNLVWEVEVD